MSRASFKKYLIVVVILMFIVIGLITRELMINKTEKVKTGKVEQNVNVGIPSTGDLNRIIMKVGEGKILQKELDSILTRYSNLKTQEEIKEKVNEAINYMKKELILLQCARDQKVIELANLDNLGFNTKERNEIIAKIKGNIAKSLLRRAKGEVISIWYNNGYTRNTKLTADKLLSEDERKKIALDKISKLHEKAKKGKAIIELAEEIKNDASLINLDHNYKGNAYYSFDSSKDISHNRETISEDLNEQIWKQKVGGITTIVDDGLSYRFAKVNDMKSGYKNFEDWFDKKCNDKKYEN